MAKSLRSLHCESITLDIPFQPEHIDKARFNKKFRKQIDPGEPYRATGNVSNNRWKEHGHITLDWDGTGYGRFWVSLHRASASAAKEEVRFESILSDVTSLFVATDLVGRSITEFRFPRTFIPTILLGYPAFAEDGTDFDSEVTGVELRYRGWEFTDKVFVRYDDEELLVSSESYYDLDLSSLDIRALAERDAEAVSKVIKRK